MRDLHSAFCFVFTSLIFLRLGGFAIHPYVISGNNVRWPKGKAIVIREKYLIQCKWFILIALQMLIFNAGGLQIPPNWVPLVSR